MSWFWLQVSLGVAPLPPGVPSHSSRSGVPQRVQTGAGRGARVPEAPGIHGEPKSELPAGPRLQETRQTQEAARDPQAGLGTMLCF